MKKRFLIVDTETTGLSPRLHQVLTVGLLLVEFGEESYDIVDERHIFVEYTGTTVDPRAMSIHGIDLKEHNLMAVSESEACRRILHFLETHGFSFDSVVGHNICFDFGFLRKMFERNDCDFCLDEEYIDTMYFWRRLQGQGKVPDFMRSRLRDLAEYFKLDYERAHDALEDCKITAEVFWRMNLL